MQPCLHEIHLAVELDALHRKKMCRQSQFIERFCGEFPLISEVVHGVYAAGTITFAGGQVRRRQSRMPVMCMYDISAPPVHLAMSKACRDPAEQRKSEMVVRPISAVLVHVGITGTRIDFSGLYQIDRNTQQVSAQNAHLRTTERRRQSQYRLQVVGR